MSVANVVAACVQPEVLVSVLLAVLAAVFQPPFKHVGDGAVVAAAVAGRQDNDVAVRGLAGVAVPVLSSRGDLPVPFGLVLEVSGLRCVVLESDVGQGALAGVVVAVVLEGEVAVEIREDEEECYDGDG